MFKNFVICLLTICLLASMHSCCTMIGHSIGKSLDEKNNPATNISISDSSDIPLVMSKIDSINIQKTNYKTLFTVVGVLADLSLAFMLVLLANPIQIDMGGF